MRRPKVAQHGRDNRIFGADPIPPGQWIYAGTYPDDTDTTALSPAFQNSWVNAGGGFQRLRFRITNEDTLQIEGAVTGGVDGTVVVTLPDVNARFRDSVFWPTETKYFVGSNGDDSTVIWKLEPNGDLTLVGTAGASSITAGAGLADTAGDFSVNVDNSTIEIVSDTLRVKASGITANEIAADAVGSSEIAAGAVGASELASSGVTAATYGDATHVPQIAVDVDGRITSASSVAITATGSVAADAIWDAKGDLAGGTGADTAARLAVGSNDQVLVADSSQTTGLKWAGIDGGSA